MKLTLSNIFVRLRVLAKNLRYNRNVGIFLFFLLISTIFWFLNELDNVYVTRISYPVKYTDPPQDKIIAEELPSKLKLKIEGTGFKILEYQLGKKLAPIEISIRSSNLNMETDSKYYLLTQSIQSTILQELSSEINILDISPDTLQFHFAEKISKTVPVVSNMEYELGQQLMLKNNISIDPDSIIVSGPNTIIDTIDSVKTKNTKLGIINNSFKTTLELEDIHSEVQYSAQKVDITIPVEQYTEGKLRKEIEIKNCPDSIILRIFPSYVQIKYIVGLSNYENVIPELFKVNVDYNETQTENEKLPVKVESSPDYLKSYSYTPHHVDYIIEKKDD
ncbi:MAG: hypothetical protein R6U04_00920 [Bacteroidales bacterium]